MIIISLREKKSPKNVHWRWRHGSEVQWTMRERVGGNQQWGKGGRIEPRPRRVNSEGRKQPRGLCKPYPYSAALYYYFISNIITRFDLFHACPECTTCELLRLSTCYMKFLALVTYVDDPWPPSNNAPTCICFGVSSEPIVNTLILQISRIPLLGKFGGGTFELKKKKFSKTHNLCKRWDNGWHEWQFSWSWIDPSWIHGHASCPNKNWSHCHQHKKVFRLGIFKSFYL